MIVFLPFRTAVGVALRYGWLWFCGWRNCVDAAVVDTQQQAKTQTHHQRQQKVVLPVCNLKERALIISLAKQPQCRM